MGWGTIIYLAAITGINPELYEAAEVDGAGRLRKIWNVTLPSIRPTIVVLLIMNLGRILGSEFDRPYAMVNPTVMQVADVISTMVYRVGIRSFQFSLTAAIGLFQSIVCVVFLILANSIAKKAGERGIW
jgi:putative aldouronate transport system permease protein